MDEKSQKCEPVVKERKPYHDERGKFIARPPGSGRKPGSRHKVTIMAQALIDGAADRVINKLIEMAESGDTAAAKAIVDRICPPRKVAPVQIDLPTIDSAESAKQAITIIIESQAAGEITSDEADGLLRSVRAWVDANAVSELEAKVNALTEALGK